VTAPPLRGVWLVLAGVAVVGATALLAIDHARSWHYFADAARLLVAGGDDGGLALYRSHPDYQFGPLAILVSLPFAALPASVGTWAVMVAGSLAGVLAFGCVVDTARSLRPAADPRAVRRVALVAGIPFVLLWLRLAAYTAHVDDVVILVLVPVGCAALARRRPGWAAVALAAAAATKPWAVVFLPVLLAAGGRRGVALTLGAGAAASLTWAPFLLGAPGTLDALRGFGIDVTPNSGLRALGLTASATPPWVRPAQLLGGLAVTSAVVLRGAWPAAPAAGVAVRLLLDPATHRRTAPSRRRPASPPGRWPPTGPSTTRPPPTAWRSGPARRASCSPGAGRGTPPGVGPAVRQVVRGRAAQRVENCLDRHVAAGRGDRWPTTGRASRATPAPSPTPSCSARCSGSPTP
jgi:hypothetical protein